MKGKHPTFHELWSLLGERISNMNQEEAFKKVRKALSDWNRTEGIQFKKKPGRPLGTYKKSKTVTKTQIYKVAMCLYQEKGIFPTIAEIISQFDEPISISTLRYRCGTMKDIADAIGAPYPKNRTDKSHLDELYKKNNPIGVLISDLYRAAIEHPDIIYVTDLINKGYTKYSLTTYRHYIGRAQQIVNLLYLKYGLHIQATKPRGKQKNAA